MEPARKSETFGGEGKEEGEGEDGGENAQVLEESQSRSSDTPAKDGDTTV